MPITVYAVVVDGTGDVKYCTYEKRRGLLTVPVKTDVWKIAFGDFAVAVNVVVVVTAPLLNVRLLSMSGKTVHVPSAGFGGMTQSDAHALVGAKENVLAVVAHANSLFVSSAAPVAIDPQPLTVPTLPAVPLKAKGVPVVIPCAVAVRVACRGTMVGVPAVVALAYAAVPPAVAPRTTKEPAPVMDVPERTVTVIPVPLETVV
jgi:hypothetical protein